MAAAGASSPAATVGRGAFILFEGADRCGKTTQCGLLLKRLEEAGHSVLHMRFPDRETAIGKIAGDYLTKKLDLDDRAIHLIFAANRWERACVDALDLKDIVEALRRGTTVVMDRYSFSGVAFSASKPTLSYDWCLGPEDVVLFMHVPTEDAEKRGGFGEERYEVKSFQERAKANFARLQRELGPHIDPPGLTPGPEGPSAWRVVDARGTIDEVQARVWALAEPVVQAVAAPESGGRLALRRLWDGAELSPAEEDHLRHGVMKP